MGEERRVFERKTLKGPARVTSPGKSPMIGRMSDISLGGACVISDANIPVKTIFQLEFNILVRKTSTLAGFRAAAIVTHVSFSNADGGFRVGLQFTSLSDTQKQLIVQYMDVKIPKAFNPEELQHHKKSASTEHTQGEESEPDEEAATMKEA